MNFNIFIYYDIYLFKNKKVRYVYFIIIIYQILFTYNLKIRKLIILTKYVGFRLIKRNCIKKRGN